MQPLIGTNDAALAERLRAALAAQQVECPPGNVVSVEHVIHFLDRSVNEPDVVVLDLAPDFDRSVAILELLRERTRARLIPIGDARDPKKILRVVHAGLDDYLEADDELAPQIEAVVRRWRSEKQRGAAGKLVTVTSASGGSGCSVLASNLAATLARDHERCALFDFDLRRGDLASFLNVDPLHTISDLCGNPEKLDKEMFQRCLHEHGTGIHLLAAPHMFADVEVITPELAERIVDLARDAFPHVVVDLEDVFHREQFRVLQLSDAILLMFRLEFSGLRNAKRTLEYLEGVGINRERVRLVANQYSRPRELSIAQAQDALDARISHFVPCDPKAIVSSINRGTPVVLESPRSKLAKSFDEIAQSILEDAASTTGTLAEAR